MTAHEGENLLQTCLNQIDASRKISEIMYYKTGNRKKASDYNRGEILTTLRPEEIETIKGKVPFIVKCFYHMEIYVAWHSDIGIGSSKYCVYRSSLEKFEENQESTFYAMSTGARDIDRVYFFRGRMGINSFFTDVVEITKKET